MHFDPAIAAQRAFELAQDADELGADCGNAIDAEAIFSASAGAEAKAAYRELQQLGERHMDSRAFQEFLIYITWQQVTEETIPTHFLKGADLCDRYLARWGHLPDSRMQQISELRRSFRAGLGLDDEEPDEYEQDTFKGGD
jgi:hypothetical protein